MSPFIVLVQPRSILASSHMRTASPFSFQCLLGSPYGRFSGLLQPPRASEGFTAIYMARSEVRSLPPLADMLRSSHHNVHTMNDAHCNIDTERIMASPRCVPSDQMAWHAHACTQQRRGSQCAIGNAYGICGVVQSRLPHLLLSV